MSGAPAKPTQPLPRFVVLFDGVCNFCEASVLFVIDRDPAGVFRFAPLQSAVGRGLLSQLGMPADYADGVVVVDTRRGVAWTKSTGAIEIGRRLGGPWRWFTLVGAMFPVGLRDGLYDWFARNRYRWFGRKEACRMPTPELRARFVDAVPA